MKFLKNQVPAIIFALAIFIQSSLPAQALPKGDIFTHDKLIHTGAYFVLAFSTLHALRFQTRFKDASEHPFSTAFMVTLLYAISDETHQLFTPGRSAEIMDLNADLLGILLALIIWKFFPTKEL
ncbi:MAG: VanZ family protein [Chloroherpetonaceae bacterium]|nr:VanZ family protein [Chloroherpetonaceae bacterium]